MHPLVDAYIKGRAVHKRGTEAYFSKKGKATLSCAVGAIYYGLYQKTFEGNRYPIEFIGDWPQIQRHVDNVPCEHDDLTSPGGSLISILIHLNDFHTKQWSDSRITEWLGKVLGDS